MSVSEFLAHPMTLLFVGAIVTGIVIPSISRGWQNRQKALEIKTELVSEVSEITMELILSVQFALQGSLYLDQEKLDEAYFQWETRSAVLGTKLEAYFRKTPIPTHWTQFSQAVTHFYAMIGIEDGQQRLNVIQKASEILTGMDASTQAATNWHELREALLVKKAALIQDILTTEISILGESVNKFST